MLSQRDNRPFIEKFSEGYNDDDDKSIILLSSLTHDDVQYFFLRSTIDQDIFLYFGDKDP